MQPLTALRRRLIGWYVATFALILLTLGAGLLLVVRRQFNAQLDASLRSAVVALTRAANIREMEAEASGKVMDAVDELHIPDRTLYLFERNGRPVKPAAADDWIREAARSAGSTGHVGVEHGIEGDRTLHLYAERVTLESGRPMVAAAVADRIELEDRYASLIAAFGLAAIASVVLVGLGSSFLVGKAVAPTQESMEHMRRFMADAAHELRTPVTILRGRAEIALQQPRSEDEYVAVLRQVERESARLGGLVSDLLTLARVDAGERVPRKERVFLDDIVLDAADAAVVVAQAKGVTVGVDEFDQAELEGDPALLRQLALILLDNAVKFTPAGGSVSLGVTTQEGSVRLSVRDSGPGISEGDRVRVFDRFYRSDSARSNTEGAGLGLSIARWIAQVHGGTITIESPPSGGTTFDVRFPAAALSSP